MEKTFEELIIEQFCEEGLIKMGFSRNDLIKMMQQVREATIAECHVIADKYYFQNSSNIIRDINELSTDRIEYDYEICEVCHSKDIVDPISDTCLNGMCMNCGSHW